jgi:hypothetical protein
MNAQTVFGRYGVDVIRPESWEPTDANISAASEILDELWDKALGAFENLLRERLPGWSVCSFEL